MFINSETLDSGAGGKENVPWSFPGGMVGKNPPANEGTRAPSLVREDPTRLRAAEPVRHNTEPASRKS